MENNSKKKKVFIVKNEEPEKEYFEALKSIDIETEWGILPQNIDDFEGLLIPGGVDINPKLYNEENTASVEINDYLDKITIDAIKLFYENNRAILGICRGMQILNAYFGGTLNQDIPNHKDVDHKIIVNSGNVLYDYYGSEFVVNSKHHQCIKTLAPNFNALAKAEDGIIEVVIDQNNKILGTQFHPEKMENGKDIFNIFKYML